ncbi:hypothetical protein BHM03_00058030 [Ensete ventricosum]|nr:hypothetical protein BHM03_00058030 [Ensete ventricosum]
MSSDAMLPHLELLPRLHRGADHDAKSLPKYDLKSTAHNRKKEQEEGIHMTPTAMMPSISMLALPEHDNVFIASSQGSDFAEGIEKIARNTMKDRRRKIMRLTVGNAVGCQIVGVRS